MMSHNIFTAPWGVRFAVSGLRRHYTDLLLFFFCHTNYTETNFSVQSLPYYSPTLSHGRLSSLHCPPPPPPPRFAALFWKEVAMQCSYSAILQKPKIGSQRS